MKRSNSSSEDWDSDDSDAPKDDGKRSYRPENANEIQKIQLEKLFSTVNVPVVIPEREITVIPPPVPLESTSKNDY